MGIENRRDRPTGGRTQHLASELTPARRGGEGAMLELRGVTKLYGGFTAVRELDLTVPRGRIFGFLGPNGAGKTTTIRMIAGVLLPTSGRILIGGDDLAEDPGAAKSRIGYIPDRPYLYEKLTGREFLRFVAGLWGMDGKASEERAGRLMELFSLSQWQNELVESYSHGMRQKLLISSALIHQPELIVVDEPMVGLDPKAARILKDLFRTYVDNGGTVFLSSHTLEVVEVICDVLAIIHEGSVIAQGTMGELRSQARAGEADLEEIFLKVTGGEEAAEVVASLRADESG
ncbi:MAG: ABC transporter ATP-binding protein [Longimicrobiales bacterium]|nr:ABC transporter ATP-binding protein [Longimicrobiales bacterium]